MNLKRDNEKKENTDIAIIGMACRFPCANHYEEYWQNLITGKDCISEVPKDRWDIKKYYSRDINEPNKSISKWGGFLDQIDCFDNVFFNISPRESENIDPQQRILLEESWHCIEDAYIKLKELQKVKTSVFIGVMALDYQLNISSSNNIDSYSCVGNYASILANRISYFLGLEGVSKSIDAACASSLVALHDACNSIKEGESVYAFAGGVSVICHPFRYISFSKARMLSPDGKCKPFDYKANGYVPGEGAGVVLLTSLANALNKGHKILGIVKGTAVNHIIHPSRLALPISDYKRK